MTLDAAQDSEEPEPGPARWGDVRRRWDTLAARFEHLMTDIEAGALGEDAARHMAAMTVALREARNARDAQAFSDIFAAEQARPADTAPMAKVYYPRFRPRHAPAHALAPAAATAGVVGRHGAVHGVSHALHIKLAALSLAAAGIAAASVTYTIRPVPDQAPAVLAQTGISPAAANPPATALPATPPPAALVRHRRHTAPAVPPPALPRTTPTPAPSPATAADPGQLNVQDASVTLQQGMDGQYTGTLTLSASGGPVRWSVDWLGTSSALRFDQAGGVLADGEPATVTVTVDAAQVTPGASWTITLDPGGQPVTVTAAG